MNRWLWLSCVLVVFLLLHVSCRQLYTTSVGESFARDKISISDKTSLKDLIDLSKNTETTSPESAKEILDVLAGKSPSDILALSTDDQTSILNLATTAAIDMSTLSNLAQDSTEEGADTNALVEAALDAFDTSVNVEAIEVVLSDVDTLATAPVDTLVLATAVVMADVADEIGTQQVMDIMASGDTSSLASNPEQRARMDLILKARTAINSRDSDDIEIAGYNLSDLLQGTQS